MVRSATASAASAALDRMAGLMPELWPELEPWCLLGLHYAPEELGACLRRHHATCPNHRASSAADLEALLAGWPHFEDGQRAVLAGTVLFLTHEGSTVTPPDLEDEVVQAAVHAVMQPRR